MCIDLSINCCFHCGRQCAAHYINLADKIATIPSPNSIQIEHVCAACVKIATLDGRWQSRWRRWRAGRRWRLNNRVKCAKVTQQRPFQLREKHFRFVFHCFAACLIAKEWACIGYYIWCKSHEFIIAHELQLPITAKINRKWNFRVVSKVLMHEHREARKPHSTVWKRNTLCSTLPTRIVWANAQAHMTSYWVIKWVHCYWSGWPLLTLMHLHNLLG